MDLITGIKNLQTIFKKHQAIEAHNHSHKILKDVVSDHSNILFVFKHFLENYYQHISKTSITSDFIIPLYSNSDFTLEMGIFGPLVDKNINYAYAMMHNHGNTILSTINAFGSGYNTIIFEKGHKINKDGTVEIIPKNFKTHTLYNIEVIKDNTAHVVFYPSELTITFTIWSPSVNKLYRAYEIIKARNLVKQIKKKYGVKDPGYVLQDHFYPENGKIYKHPYAVQSRPGNNFFHNFCYKLQKIGFDDFSYLDKKFSATDLISLSYKNLKKGEKLHIMHESDEMIAPKRNPHFDEFIKAFGHIDGM